MGSGEWSKGSLFCIESGSKKYGLRFVLCVID
jgi:hypothetical protein